ncbi:hypothetical protein MMC08_006322 [Hypocenomyce scalaris]|nr:hypothetical protein [Hypocenomyce scalaris]
MPACTVHLLSLSSPISVFLSALNSTRLEPLVTSKVIRWIITPTTLSTSPLLTTQWHIMLIVPTTDPLPASLETHIRASFSLPAGVPSRLVDNFAATNAKLLRPDKGGVPALTGALGAPRVASSAQSLELSPTLQSWIQDFSQQEGRGAVSMLNLLAFAEGKKADYLQYGKAFAESIGSRRGGNAKIVGNVIGKKDGWDEMALAHYPSILHFADMLASEDYQEVNHKYRVGSLRDTCILCTSELSEELKLESSKL